MKSSHRFALLLIAAAPLTTPAAETVQFGRFAAAAVYRPAGPPVRMVLWLTDAAGGNDADAQALARGGGLVVGIDGAAYLKALGTQARGCLYPAADFEALSQHVQKRLGLPRYRTPVLAGRGRGAALAFAALAQAPVGTFAGAVSIGSCPALALARAPCNGTALAASAVPGGYRLTATQRLSAPWIVVSEPGMHCDAGTLTAAVTAAGGTLHARPGVADATTLATLVAGLDTPPSQSASGAALADLPLVEVPARAPAGDALAVILSGDGGWAGLDRELAAALATRGYPVVGLDSLQYFWKRRTPDEAGHDLARVLRHYLATWDKERAILIGYSRGADVLPFMANRLPADLRTRVALVALVGPSTTVEFEFHVGDWLRNTDRPAALPVAPEVGKLHGLRLLCVHGADETDSLCPRLPAGMARTERLGGGHHFGGDYAALARLVLDAAAPVPRR